MSGGNDTPPEPDNSAVNDSAQKVVDALSDNKGSDWKKALSGALDEERLLCALVVLCIFYIGLTLANAYHENNNKDEDAIIKKCGCRSEHRAFYIAWLTICYVLWFLFHTLVLLHDNPNLVPRKAYNDDNDHWKWKCCYNIPISNSKGNMDIESARQDHENEKQCKEIEQYRYHLWTQYYELYVVGITKNAEKYGQKQVHNIIANILKAKPKQTKEQGEPASTTNDKKPLVACEQSQPTEEDPNASRSTDIHQSSAQGTTTALPHHTTYNKFFYFQAFLHSILAFIRYSAQLAVVPLLMIQILDTYAYLCFTADNYCSMNSQYKLHLDQTAMTFAFYCSLMISLLSTTMLQWFPYPKMKEDSSAQSGNKETATEDQPQVQQIDKQNRSNGNEIATEDEDEYQLEFQARSPTWPLHNHGHRQFAMYNQLHLPSSSALKN